MTSISNSPVKNLGLTRRKRQQGDVARALDGGRKPALVRRAHAGQATGNDLAPLGHKLLQQAHVLVIDVVNFLDAELAHLLAAEKLAATFAAAVGPVAAFGPVGPALRPLWRC